MSLLPLCFVCVVCEDLSASVAVAFKCRSVTRLRTCTYQIRSKVYGPGLALERLLPIRVDNAQRQGRPAAEVGKLQLQRKKLYKVRWQLYNLLDAVPRAKRIDLILTSLPYLVC